MEGEMTTIKQQAGCTTLINVFTVEPGRAVELTALLRAATDEVMHTSPVSSRRTSTSARIARG
jgi:hypothetical protein